MRPALCFFVLCFVAGCWARPDAIALALADAKAVLVSESEPHPIAWPYAVATPFTQQAPGGTTGGGPTASDIMGMIYDVLLKIMALVGMKQ